MDLADDSLKLAINHWKTQFLTNTQALLHGDLHTGSVMAAEGSTFVIDPEFAFYGSYSWQHFFPNDDKIMLEFNRINSLFCMLIKLFVFDC